MANMAIGGILEKMTGKDKDFRYMATSDLLNELSKDGFKADHDMELRISITVLQQLDDQSGDVSELAVKCLAPLVKKVSEGTVLDMTEKLCDKILNGKDQHRDIATIAMKTIVSEITSTSVAQRVLVSLLPQLVKGITAAGMTTEIRCECLDILCDVLNRFGNLMTADHGLLLNSLLSQLSSNQATVRIKSISCIESLASSLSDDLLATATVKVVQLLRNTANRALRQATLGTLNFLLVAYGDKIASSAYEVIIAELSALISDSDLHMTALALVLCSNLMTDGKSSPNVGLTVMNKVLPKALTLIRSSFLQENALQALQSFFAALVHSGNTSFDALLESLLSSAKQSPQSGGLAKQALHSVAQCVAVLCLAAGDQKCGSTVEMLTKILKDDCSTNSAKRHLALLCLGEIGRRKDLSLHAGIESLVIESFQSPFEEIKSAASYTLGNIAVGNLSKYLPFILDQIDNQQKNQYLLLSSLKEVIARQSVDKAVGSEFQDTSVEKISKLLYNHCESEEEGVRNLVAECLGKIALIEPTKLVPALKTRARSVSCERVSRSAARGPKNRSKSVPARSLTVENSAYEKGTTHVAIRYNNDQNVLLAADGCHYHLTNAALYPSIDCLPRPDYYVQLEDKLRNKYGMEMKALDDLGEIQLGSEHRAKYRKKSDVLNKHVSFNEGSGKEIIGVGGGDVALFQNIAKELFSVNLRRNICLHDCRHVYRVEIQKEENKGRDGFYYFASFEKGVLKIFKLHREVHFSLVGDCDAAGAGEMYAKMVLRGNYRPNMTLQEARFLAIEALEAASIVRCSGGKLDFVSLNSSNVSSMEDPHFLWPPADGDVERSVFNPFASPML